MTVVKVIYKKRKTGEESKENKSSQPSSERKDSGNKKPHKKRRYSKPVRTPEEQERARKVQEESERNRLAKEERRRLHREREERRKEHLRRMEKAKEAKRLRKLKPEKERERKRVRTAEGIELLETSWPELSSKPDLEFGKYWALLKAELKERSVSECWSRRHTRRQIHRLKLALKILCGDSI